MSDQRRICPTCNSKGFPVSKFYPDRCSFCDGTEGGNPPTESDLKEFQDSLSRRCFGMTISEANERGICIACKQPAIPKCYSDAGRAEYRISGLCEECFDKITSPADPNYRIEDEELDFDLDKE